MQVKQKKLIKYKLYKYIFVCSCRNVYIAHSPALYLGVLANAIKISLLTKRKNKADENIYLGRLQTQVAVFQHTKEAHVLSCFAFRLRASLSGTSRSTRHQRETRAVEGPREGEGGD